MVLSHYILDELARVLPRLPRIAFTQSELRDLLDSLMFIADVVEPNSAIEVELRDEKDQPVLQTFLAADVNYLITGDKDLLALSDRYAIVSPGEFWRRHG